MAPLKQHSAQPAEDNVIEHPRPLHHRFRRQKTQARQNPLTASLERPPMRSSRRAFLAAASSEAVKPSLRVLVSSSMKLASTFGVLPGLAIAEAENAAASPSTGATKLEPTL